MFKKLLDWLFPVFPLHTGKMIVRLYERPSSGPEERIAFTGIGVSRFRFVGSDIHVEDVSVDLSSAQRLPDITKVTFALEYFPDLEAEPRKFQNMDDLCGPMTLHFTGIGDADLLEIAR